jgi:HNH endonuclease
MAAPNKSSVLRAIREFHSIGEDEFLDQYSSGRSPRAYYLFYEDSLYPLKAIWAAAHRPAIQTREFIPGDARRGFESLGFTTIIAEEAWRYKEGARQVKEITMFARNPALVSAAKLKYGFACAGCGFEFAKFYGEIGRGYIECHHLKPVASKGGKTANVLITEVAVLCANCHRMVHRKNRPLSLNELKRRIHKASISD